MSSLLELFLSCCIVVTVAKGNLIEMSAIILLANFQRIQMLRHPWLAFDWLSVSFFDCLPIRMSGFLLFFCPELTLFCIVLPENCIYLNQSELSNFSCLLLVRKSYAWFQNWTSAQRQFDLISDQNCTTRGSITTFLHPFWNRKSHLQGLNKLFLHLKRALCFCIIMIRYLVFFHIYYCK